MTLKALYNHSRGDQFFLTLMNCDLNVYGHIPYKPYKIVTIGKKTLQNSSFMLE
jgi:hypothetical protein